MFPLCVRIITIIVIFLLLNSTSLGGFVSSIIYLKVKVFRKWTMFVLGKRNFWEQWVSDTKILRTVQFSGCLAHEGDWRQFVFTWPWLVGRHFASGACSSQLCRVDSLRSLNQATSSQPCRRLPGDGQVGRFGRPPATLPSATVKPKRQHSKRKLMRC